MALETCEIKTKDMDQDSRFLILDQKSSHTVKFIRKYKFYEGKWHMCPPFQKLPLQALLLLRIEYQNFLKFPKYALGQF